MPITPFDALPDHGRLWVFPSSRELTEAEADALLADVDEFLGQWAAHGVPLQAGRRLADGQFLLVGVNVDAERPSGCSIDSLVKRLGAFGERSGIRLIDHTSIWYRNDGGVRCVSRAEFRNLAAAGTVSRDTRVFDTTLTKVAQVRTGELERVAEQAWHGRAFFRELVAG